MKPLKFLMGAIVSTTIITSGAYAVMAVPGSGGVSPTSYEGTLNPGESDTITKTVTVPTVTPKLDLMLVTDSSGTYGDDFANLKLLSTDIVSGVRSVVPDSRFGLATFSDYYCNIFSLKQPLTSDENAWISAVNSLTVECGGAEPMPLAIYLSTGEGWDENKDGDYNDFGEVPPQPIGWRSEASKVIIASTDEPTQFYGSLDLLTLRNKLLNDKFKLILLKAEYADNKLDSLAIDSGGAIVNISSDSSDIINAILQGISQLTFTITANPVGCDPLVITFSPSEYTNVSGGDVVDFQESISVPVGTAAGVYECDVEFKADDTVIGTQHIKVTVPGEKEQKMTGSGYLKGFPTVRISALLNCDPSKYSSMTVSWRGKTFILQNVTSATCYDDPAYEPNGDVNFDTYCGTGTGTLNGKSATAEWCISDNGFPGRNKDVVEIKIEKGSKVLLDKSSVLRSGNFTARETQ